MSHALPAAIPALTTNAGAPVRLLFAGPEQPIAVNAPAEAVAALEDLIPLWPPLDGNGVASHEIAVWQDEDGWHVARNIQHPARAVFEDAHAAANEVINCLIGCYLAQRRDLLCLHAAAVEIADGLLVLLGTNHAGKSTLAAALAALGHRFVCDDELIVDLSGSQPIGIALGAAPKLRLPLPPTTPAWFRTFYEAHLDTEWSLAAALYLDRHAAARNGERRPIAALVDLRRDDTAGAASLDAVRRGDTVRLLLDQVMAPKLHLEALLSAAAAQVRERVCYRLSYADSFAAAELLSRRFPPPRTA